MSCLACFKKNALFEAQIHCIASTKQSGLTAWDPWSNGSAFDSRSKGYPFKSGGVQTCRAFPFCQIALNPDMWDDHGTSNCIDATGRQRKVRIISLLRITLYYGRKHQPALMRRHQSLPCRTCQSQSHTSIAMPRNPAMQIPPLSLTVVALKLNSRSAMGTLSMISANVLT